MSSASLINAALDIDNLEVNQNPPSLGKFDFVECCSYCISSNWKYLKSGEAIITKSGDIYGRSYQILNQPSNNQDNRLLRIKQLEIYEKEIPGLTSDYQKLSDTLKNYENANQDLRLEIIEITEILKKSNDKKNHLSFEYNKLLNIISAKQNVVITDNINDINII